jgi:5-methylcytosine-specific restriction protein A
MEPKQLTPAVAVDHKIPHRGDINLFLTGALSSLCARHHAFKGRIESSKSGKPIIRIGTDGFPVDETAALRSRWMDDEGEGCDED